MNEKLVIVKCYYTKIYSCITKKDKEIKIYFVLLAGR